MLGCTIDLAMHTMKHTLFLFDLDDTLLDFKASENLSFVRTMHALGVAGATETLFNYYQPINVALWRAFEHGTVSKDFLKVERFRQTFQAAGLVLDPNWPAGSTSNRCRTRWC